MIHRQCRTFIAILLCATLGTGLLSASAPAPQKSFPPLPTPKRYEDMVIGYAQLGAESNWRNANTTSIKNEADRLGVELKFIDAQQKQENQTKAIRTFIAQQVDVIGVSPIVETGWEAVFQEAKEAGIPIILMDRRANVAPTLYTAYIGADFTEEGRKAARIIAELLNGQGKIIELTGTINSTPANGRSDGFRAVLKDYPRTEIIAAASGDFTLAKSREAMADLLKIYGADINAVYAHNDDMAIGAIQAIEAFGLKPGEDIKIVSIDATRIAFEAMIAGKLNATVECNPLLGPQFFELALKIVNGQNVPKWIKPEEGVFYPDNATQILPTRLY